MNEPLTAVPTEEPDPKEILRALHEAIWRIDAVFRAVESDIPEDGHISKASVLLVESGMEAVSVSLNLLEELPDALGIDMSCHGETGLFWRAYTHARSKDRAIGEQS